MKSTSTSLIAQAAEMRAAGESWEAIAKALDRSCTRIRHWPREHAAEWNRAFHAATVQQVIEGAHEAAIVLRRQMRSPDDKVALAAAKEMSKVRMNMRKLDLEEEAQKAAAATKTVPPPPAEPKPALSNWDRLQGTPDEPTKEELTKWVRDVRSMSEEEVTHLLDPEPSETYIRRAPEKPAAGSVPGSTFAPLPIYAVDSDRAHFGSG